MAWRWLETARGTWGALADAWRGREPESGRTREEAAFLPRLEEIEESPASPTARVTLWTMLAVLGTGLLWSYFGKTDVVAVATGEIIPDKRVKVVQAAAGGIVRKIGVADGDAVEHGQELFVMEAAEAEAAAEQVREQIFSRRLEAAMHGLLIRLAAEESPEIPRLANLAHLKDVPAERIRRQQQVLDGIYEAHADAVSEISKDLATLTEARRSQLESIRDAEETMLHKEKLNDERLRGEQTQIDKVRQLLPLAQEEHEALLRLHADEVVSLRQVRQAEEKYVSLKEDFAYRLNQLGQIELEGEGERLDLRQKIHRHNDRIAELDTEMAKKRETLKRIESEFRRTHLQQKEASEQEIARLRQELVKMERALENLRVLAPASGVVQELAVHTEGAVVQPSQQLLVIVPEDQELEIEAIVENKDIGFIRAGQRVEVRVDTFPYTKYGLLEGEVLHLSPAAVQVEGQGLVYLARIRIGQTSMNIDGRQVRLSPGMRVTAEIKIGKRRVIEFFLAPLLRASSESLRER